MSSCSGDRVFLRGLRFDLCVGQDAWGRVGKPQPVKISLQIEPAQKLEEAAAGDDVSKTLDYGKLYKLLTSKLAGQQFESTWALYVAINECVPPSWSTQIDIALPKASLRATGGVTSSVHHTIKPGHKINDVDGVDSTWTMTVKGITCACIIGVNPHERLQKQILIVDLIFNGSKESAPATANADVPSIGYPKIIQTVAQRVESSTFETIEALATAVAQTVTMDCGQSSVTVRIEKPSAIATIEAAGVQLHRRRSFFAKKDFWQVGRQK